MKKKYEILAPAGNFESLKAAVQNGADAVYIAGKDFGARKYAGNFSNEELVKAIEYCHIRYVCVYVTINTLVFNQEFGKLSKYIDFLYQIGTDAVIVQDIGVLKYISKVYSDLDIHCSTQMSVQTVEDIKYLDSLGVSRVVLGREMTIDDIKKAKEETNVELEVFVHGSLCISVSGQCLMSSMIGGRSGNRGSCAQPCRQKYTLYDMGKDQKIKSLEGDYLLSPKDLSTLDNIMTVIEEGAYSLKIEGRMKGPEYVGTVVKSYKSMIDGAFTNATPHKEKLLKELKVFNRGFTKGHLFNESGINLMSLKSPSNHGYYLGEVINYDNKSKKVSISLSEDINHNDEIQIRRNNEIIGSRVEILQYQGKNVKKCLQDEICEVNFKYPCKIGDYVYKTYDQEYMKLIRQSYNKETLDIPISIEIKIKSDNYIKCAISDGKNRVLKTINFVPEKAVKRATTREDIKNQLSKLGATPYKLADLNIELDEGLSVPVKIINEIRRILVENLDKTRVKRYNRKSKLEGEQCFTPITKEKIDPVKIKLTYSVNNLSQLNAVLDSGAKIIYYKDMESLPMAVEITKHNRFHGKLIPEISNLLSSSELVDYKKLITNLNLDTVLIQSYGHIQVFKGLNMISDYKMNVMNDFSYNFYLNNSFRRITLSPELNLSQIYTLGVEPQQTEVIGYGYIPVMSMKHCVISTILNRVKNCGLCHKSSYSLLDRMGGNFRVKRKYQCNTEIYNSKKLMLIEDYKKLEKGGVGYFRLNFLNETPKEIEGIIELHKKFITDKLTSKEYETIEKIKKMGVTKGQLNRGLE